MQPIRFHLNDRLVEERDVSPTTTLLQYLRGKLSATGTKEGCAEGDCGACTVAVLDPDARGGPTFRAVNSCLVMLPMVHGSRVFTVEGLTRGAPHPAQESLVQELGSQCGYCTPGVVMSMFEATYRRDLDAPWKLDDQLAGNLCRCTGYRPIRDAARKVAGTLPDDHFRALLDGATASGDELRIAYEARGQRWFTPATLEELWDVLDANPDARLIAGATDLGLDVTKKDVRFPCLVSVLGIPALRTIERTTQGWSLGATASLADVEAHADTTIPALARMLRFFGARQIKNRATLGGNLCNASPIGDTPPVLLALDATVVLASREGERRVPLDAFFTGYRATVRRPDEIVARVEVPDPEPDSRIAAYKVSKRRELDISAVAAGILVRVDASGVVTTARVAFGGMAATPARARGVEAALVGSPWCEETVERAAQAVSQDFTPIDDHRGSAWYRATVAANLLRGFFIETLHDLVPRLPDRPSGTVLPEVAP